MAEANAGRDCAADGRTPPTRPWRCRKVGTGVHSWAVHVRDPGTSEERPGWEEGTGSVLEKADPSSRGTSCLPPRGQLEVCSGEAEQQHGLVRD